MERVLVPEEMDDPRLAEEAHFHALQGLERINAWSRSADILLDPIQALAKISGQRLLRVLDIATGAGDVPIKLWKKARQQNLRLEIDACDKSPQALQYAHRKALEKDAPIRFFNLDITQEDIPKGYDVVMSSLFFHHLSDDQAKNLLKRMAGAAERMVLVNDLARSISGLALAHLGTRILSRSSIVHTDGVRSVRAAFTLGEMKAMAQAAGLQDAQIKSRWPSRFLLTGRK